MINFFVFFSILFWWSVTWGLFFLAPHDSGVPYYVSLVLVLFSTLSNLKIWMDLFRVCSFFHRSDLESGLFIFSNWRGWVYILSTAFLEYPLCGDDCGMWGWGPGKYGKYYSEPRLLRETNVTRPLWLQTLLWQPLWVLSQEQGIGTGAVGYVPDWIFRTSLYFLSCLDWQQIP